MSAPLEITIFLQLEKKLSGLWCNLLPTIQTKKIVSTVDKFSQTSKKQELPNTSMLYIPLSFWLSLGEDN